MKYSSGIIDVERLDEAIDMLNTYASENGLESFISILEALKQEPANEALLADLVDAFENLGLNQGVVLTYAPSIYSLIVVNPFND